MIFQSARAQQVEGNYYAIEDLTTGSAIRRGVNETAQIPRGQLILAPRTKYRIWSYNSGTGLVGSHEFTTSPAGTRFEIPAGNIRRTTTGDADFDGLSDEIEFIIGTSASEADTDGDGTPDGAEVTQGTDPLDGLAVATGLIASVDTEGTALDVAAFNNIVILANAEEGISAFNVFNRMNPTIIADVDTPGRAQGVAYGGGTRIAVADGTAGVAIVDISDPPTASIIHQFAMMGEAEAVTVSADLAFAGSSAGQIIVIDLTTGNKVVDSFPLSGKIHDLVWSGDNLYALTADELSVFAFDGAELTRLGQLAGMGPVNPRIERQRLRVGGGIAYATWFEGFRTIDVSDPTGPSLLASYDSPQFGWMQVVPNGSGLALAVTGQTSPPDTSDHITLFNVSDPTVLNVAGGTYPTPGDARAATIFNGLAYVADGAAGLQVVNYIPEETAGLAPSLIFSVASPIPGLAEEGNLLRLVAEVADDVQVRNVEFFVDGQRIVTDGGFPFEFRVRAPLLEGRPTLSIRLGARASDTRGNFSDLQELTLQVTPDATPPQVVKVFPSQEKPGIPFASVSIVFSELMHLASVSPDSVNFLNAGPDFLFGTPDDFVAGEFVVQQVPETNGVNVQFSDPIPRGLYRVEINGQAFDLAGNALLPYREELLLMTPLDEFFADARSGSGTGSVALQSDQQYLVEMVGTYSAWVRSQWNSVCLGTPESTPMFPTPGVTNGRVGIDPAFAFAIPTGASACSSTVPIPIAWDYWTGTQWMTLRPILDEYDPTHAYLYLVSGAVGPFRVRLVDTLGDNYGRMRVRVFESPL